MKSTIKILGVLFLLNITSLVCPKTASAQENVSIQTFYDELSPYGQWTQNPKYEGYVWIPNAGSDFTPYQTAGHWACTDYGWTWVSDYAWGWAPFHYGRWDNDPSYGWFWVPGNEWGPAWVSWRRTEGYYGWAPMAPGIELAMYDNGYVVPADRWVFCDERYVADPYCNRYYAPRERNAAIFQNTTVINYTYVENTSRTTYVSGPRIEEVQRVSATPVRRVEIANSSAPGQTIHSNDRVSIYRPNVNKIQVSGNAQPAPRRITERQEVTAMQERKSVTQSEGNQPERMNNQNSYQNHPQTQPAAPVNHYNPQSQPARANQQAPGNQQMQQSNINKSGNPQQARAAYVSPKPGAPIAKSGKR